MEDNEQSFESQNAKILAYLLAGNKITQLEAYEMFGCWRLSGRIHNLRAAGAPIKMERVKTKSGKLVGQYRLAPDLYALYKKKGAVAALHFLGETQLAEDYAAAKVAINDYCLSQNGVGQDLDKQFKKGIAPQHFSIRAKAVAVIWNNRDKEVSIEEYIKK